MHARIAHVTKPLVALLQSVIRPHMILPQPAYCDRFDCLSCACCGVHCCKTAQDMHLASIEVKIKKASRIPSRSFRVLRIFHRRRLFNHYIYNYFAVLCQLQNFFNDISHK